MDRGFYFEENEGLFNKNTNERVSYNLDHRSPEETDIETPFPMAQWRATYTQGDRGRTIPDSSSHSYAYKDNTNKLEKVLILSKSQSHVALTAAL